MDVETMAQTMFAAFHERNNRRRFWNMQADGDIDVEHGRDTFRAMAQAVLDRMAGDAAPAPAAEPVVEAAPIEAAPVQEGA